MLEKVIYTLGTSTRGLSDFLEILKKYQIEQVVDVRSFPKSRRFPHFNREVLEETLPRIGVTYCYLGKELGGYRKGGYEEHMKTSLFEAGIKSLENLAREKKSVFICAEKFPWRCHRRFISQELEKQGWQVRHIIEKEKVWRPKKRNLNRWRPG